VTLRPEAVQARLLRLEEVIGQLQELGRLDLDTLRRNLRDIWAAERGLQLGAEILFDIGNHILSAYYSAPAEAYEDILEQMAVHGVLPLDLRRQLKGLGGFRNLLVHDYLRLDPQKVWEHLRQAPQDFSAFAQAVRRWLEELE
jgi:uncharacterized protein YutE (UPF0331/DUF86 family)